MKRGSAKKPSKKARARARKTSRKRVSPASSAGDDEACAEMTEPVANTTPRPVPSKQENKLQATRARAARSFFEMARALQPAKYDGDSLVNRLRDGLDSAKESASVVEMLLITGNRMSQTLGYGNCQYLAVLEGVLSRVITAEDPNPRAVEALMKRYKMMIARTYADHNHNEFDPTSLKGALIVTVVSKRYADKTDRSRGPKQECIQDLAQSASEAASSSSARLWGNSETLCLGAKALGRKIFVIEADNQRAEAYLSVNELLTAANWKSQHRYHTADRRPLQWQQLLTVLLAQVNQCQ